jgi:hypothetical protein
VVEQRQNNVGFPQGTILKRHRVPLPAPNDDRFYTFDQFNVGAEVSFYGRVYKLIDCDPFTRNFLTKLGVRAPPGMNLWVCISILNNFIFRFFGTGRSIS